MGSYKILSLNGFQWKVVGADFCKLGQSIFEKPVEWRRLIRLRSLQCNTSILTLCIVKS